MDSILKQTCDGCESTVELYGSACKHLTLCLSCGKSMAEKGSNCYECGAPISRLIREYNVRASVSSDKDYFIGRFVMGLPNFKNNENKWSLQKCLRRRQVTDALREKYKNDKKWLLDCEAGQFQYDGQPECTLLAPYYLLMLQGKEFVAIPADSWFCFNKMAKRKQLTLEEIEEKMKNRRRTAIGHQIRLKKAAHRGAAAFGIVEKCDSWDDAAGGWTGRKKIRGDGSETSVSDSGEEDEDEDEEAEAVRKSHIGFNKKSRDGYEERPRGGDIYFNIDDLESAEYYKDMESGDDWDHEVIFSDDDETAGPVDSEEEQDLITRIPVPPEANEDDEDEDEAEEEEGGLSKSGKELKKLLQGAYRLNDFDAEEDNYKYYDEHEADEEEGFLSIYGEVLKTILAGADRLNDINVEDDCDYHDMGDDIFPEIAPKKEAPKKEPVDNSSPCNPTTSAAVQGSPSTLKSSEGKRNGEESKTPNAAPFKN